MRTLDDELILREEQRRKYFKNPKYRKWSDVVDKCWDDWDSDENDYGGMTDCSIILSLVKLSGRVSRPYKPIYGTVINYPLTGLISMTILTNDSMTLKTSSPTS